MVCCFGRLLRRRERQLFIELSERRRDGFWPDDAIVQVVYLFRRGSFETQVCDVLVLVFDI